MAAIAPTPCPKCGGQMWDETKSKFYDPSKNRPIAKCKDKSCDGAVWPPKGTAKPQPVPQSPQGRNIGNLPGWPADEQEQEERQFVEQMKAQEDRGSVAFHELCRLHMACLRHVIKHEAPELFAAEVAITDQGLSALAAQIFIEANRRGVVLPRPAHSRAA